MTFLSTMVSTSLDSNESPVGPLTTGFIRTATVFSIARNMWGWALFSETYGNSNNWLGLAIGHTLDYLIGDKEPLRIPFIPFLIGRRFFALLAQEDALEQAYQQWKDTIRDIHPIATPKNVSHFTFLTPLISQERQVRWIISSKKLWVRVQRIALSTLKLLFEAYKVVMRMMDVIDLFAFDGKRFEALLRQSVRESVVNIALCMEALKRNENHLMARLIQIKPLIEDSLQFFKLPINSDDVIDKTRTLFKTSNAILDAFQKISAIFGDGVVDLGKNLIYELSSQNADVANLMKFDPDNNFWTNLGSNNSAVHEQELMFIPDYAKDEKTDQKLSWPLFIPD